MNRLMAVDWSPKNKINDPSHAMPGHSSAVPHLLSCAPVRNNNNNHFQFAYSQAQPCDIAVYTADEVGLVPWSCPVPSRPRRRHLFNELLHVCTRVPLLFTNPMFSD